MKQPWIMWVNTSHEQSMSFPYIHNKIFFFIWDTDIGDMDIICLYWLIYLMSTAHRQQCLFSTADNLFLKTYGK